MKVIGLLVALSLVAIPMAACSQENEHPTRSLEEIKKSAENFLEQNKYVKSSYDLKDISYSYTREKWTLMYESKSLAIGDHFFLEIKKNENVVKYIPGL